MAMTIVERDRAITGGVDTHLDVHVAAALDPVGGLLGVESFEVNARGYRALVHWMGSFGAVHKVGVEGTGAYGAGLARYLQKMGIDVVEVDRPNRQARRQSGKSDPADAVEAARAALSGRAAGTPKTRNGRVEAIRALVVAKRSARRARIAALCQMRQLSFTAPDHIREHLKGLSSTALWETCASLRPRPSSDVVDHATKVALRSLGRRIEELEGEVAGIDALLGELVTQTAPGLGPLRRGHRHRRQLARDGRRQPRAPSLRGRLRPSLRGGTHRSVLGQGGSDTASTAVGTATPTRRCGASSWCASSRTRGPGPTWSVAPRTAARSSR